MHPPRKCGKSSEETLHVAWRLANLEAKPASQESKHHICECGPCWRHCKCWGKRTSQIHPKFHVKTPSNSQFSLLKIGQAPKRNDSNPTINFSGAMLVSGRVFYSCFSFTPNKQLLKCNLALFHVVVVVLVGFGLYPNRLSMLFMCSCSLNLIENPSCSPDTTQTRRSITPGQTISTLCKRISCTGCHIYW